MSHTIKSILRYGIRLAILWLVDALSMAATAWVIPAVRFQATEATPRGIVILSAALLLAAVNLLIRPIILLLAVPLGWIMTFLVGFLVNAASIQLTAWLLPGFDVTFGAALLAGIVLAFFNTILTNTLDIEEEGSWYQNRIERLAKRQRFSGSDEPGRGMMLVEIDGLSYWHIRKALDQGLLPTLQKMIDEEGYQLSLTDCGLPSMTSSCQAGIMFGDNEDIPAYRWFDKSKNKTYVSAEDAPELNARYAHGHGLMRRGSSIMNMMDGDAEKSMFTMANLLDASDEEEARRRSADIRLLMLDPYFLTREIVLFLAETGRELWEGWQQRRHHVRPRLNRLAHGYPFVRAGTCVFMRDISANIAVMDMMRGAPVIYMLYLGYDEVAHHSGPWTDDAFGDLRRLDRTFERLHRAAKKQSHRPYDLIVLSDHGQSFGATFKQRYGVTIKEFIESLLPDEVTVAQAIGGDTGAAGLASVAGELAKVDSDKGASAFDRLAARQGRRLAAAGAQANRAEVSADDLASVTAYGSGNAAQVYFDLFPRKIKLSELETAYPGMVQAVVQHEGIGLVLGYEDDGTVVVMGKGGRRNLHTGEVIGDDPVAPYARASGAGAASIEKRVWQLKRVMEFPHAGDLWVISTLYEDGTVAALEELVGNHGGLGGEQTDAFVLHPPDLEISETRNATDVFHLLNRHRDAPIHAARDSENQADDKKKKETQANFREGIGRVDLWPGYALRALLLDRSAYQAVADNPAMTGPALLIALTMAALNSLIRSGSFNAPQLLGDILVWFSVILAMTVAGRLITRRTNIGRMVRTAGFASSVLLLSLLALIPPLRSAVMALIMVWSFVALWMAGAVADKTDGWRTLLLPVLALLVWIAGAALVGMMASGVEFTLQSILQSFGITPG
ncbi:MAG: phage holin family protein [Caldilineaceae bacterium]|nr:phage holin family protein [Caldilineaceae bacterium]